VPDGVGVVGGQNITASTCVHNKACNYKGIKAIAPEVH